MNHGSSCGVGHDRALGAAHLIQTAAGAGEADDDSGNKHHKDGHANGDGRSEPSVAVQDWAKEVCLSVHSLLSSLLAGSC